VAVALVFRVLTGLAGAGALQAATAFNRPSQALLFITAVAVALVATVAVRQTFRAAWVVAGRAAKVLMAPLELRIRAAAVAAAQNNAAASHMTAPLAVLVLSSFPRQ
jgi:hypothetical protein